jgi:hypothetical protein
MRPPSWITAAIFRVFSENQCRSDRPILLLKLSIAEAVIDRLAQQQSPQGSARNKNLTRVFIFCN